MNYFVMSEAVREAYRGGENEEAMEPLVLFEDRGHPVGRIQDGDQIVFYDIRGEREVELTSAFVCSDFNYFTTQSNFKTDWVTMIEYHRDLPVGVVFPPVGQVQNTLCDILSRNGYKQCLISESEKAIHVGFFFNGKKSDMSPLTDKIVVPSPEDGGNYELFPEMNAKGVTEKTLETMDSLQYHFILVNYCNVDVLGHTENKEAVLKALNRVDSELGRLVDAALRNDYTVLVTADHGTVEQYLYPDGSIDTGHTISDVPCLLIQNEIDGSLKQRGSLTDMAPTIMDLFQIQKPDEMTGQSLLINHQHAKCDKVLLIILDGWGYNPESYGNLIDEAHIPNFRKLMKKYSYTYLQAAGEAVGLPENTVGNSEVGHLHLGGGRVIPSDKVRIQRAMDDGSFFTNQTLLSAMDRAKTRKKGFHLIGIVSFFSSHGSIDYAFALLKMAREQGVQNVYVHGLLGRRGERPESGAYYIRQIEEMCQRLEIGQVVSVIGRHWALDREYHWDRIEKTYRMLVYGEGNRVFIHK